MVKISVSIKSNRLPSLAGLAKAGVRAAVQKAVFDVEAGCKVRSRVDTGAMRNAWQGRMTGDTEGEVANGVEYAIYNEYGTAKMPAQPMAHPAADAARPGFEAAIKQAIAGL
jgi:HK97 gp10 family phage protein